MQGVKGEWVSQPVKDSVIQLWFYFNFQILTWLNPIANVQTSKDLDFEPAFDIKSETIGTSHSASRNVSKTFSIMIMRSYLF